MLGAAGFWAASIGVLWASFHAFGVHVPLAVVVQGFFLGMVANLFPLAPAGVGAVDAGMIGAFVLFGIPEDDRLPGDPGLPPGRLLDADPARHRRLLPAAQNGPPLGRQRGCRSSAAATPNRTSSRPIGGFAMGRRGGYYKK